MKYKLLALAVLIAVVFCFSGSAKALTSEEISTQIEALQAQIVQLQAQLAQLQSQSAIPETSSTSAWCRDFNINLKAGATGDEVVALQTALAKEGFDVSADQKGEFSHATYAAVVDFQEKYAAEILAPERSKSES